MDKGYDRDAFRDALSERGIAPCIPPRAKRKSPATYCKALYKQRHKVENMFAKLKDLLSGMQAYPAGQGATYRNALRPLRSHLLQCHMHSSNCHLLAGSMSPDPRDKAVSATGLATFKNKPNDQPRLGRSELRELAKMATSGGRDISKAHTMQSCCGHVLDCNQMHTRYSV